MKQLFIPICLVGLGVSLIAIEAIIPSAGVLGILAALALLAGVLSAFYYGGLTVGTAFMIATVVVVWIFITYLIRNWPNTTLGKLILVEPPPTEELLPDRSEIHSMVGRVGQALSLMLPSGLVEIDGRRFDASAETSVEQGAWVEVISVRNGSNLIVRPVDEERAMRAQNGRGAGGGSLDRLNEDVISDPFEEPP